MEWLLFHGMGDRNSIIKLGEVGWLLQWSTAAVEHCMHCVWLCGEL